MSALPIDDESLESEIAAAASEIDLSEALYELARGSAEDLRAFLQDVQVNSLIDGTRVTSHVHALTVDGNGSLRFDAFVKRLALFVLDYAIPRSEIRAAKEADDRDGTTFRVIELRDRAVAQFSQLVKSGEGGELLLFALAERYLGLPQIMCKMALKTSPNVHYHGSDGLHAGVHEESENLVLYWGESKIYADPISAIRDCLSSLRPMLLPDADVPGAETDLLLLQRFMDLDDPDLEEALKRFLDPSSPEFNTLEFRGLCLVGCDSESYPPDGTRGSFAEISSAVMAELPSWLTQINSRVGTEQLTDFAIHFILVPLPSAASFREKFRGELGMPAAEPDEPGPEGLGPGEHEQ